MQTRDNLKVFRGISILPIVRNLSLLSAPLLLRLSDLDPLLCCQMLSKLRKGVLSQSQFIKQWTVLDRIEDDMVVGSINKSV